jgi:TRAP-type C4-dicarboxylate transport system substrate-binding protein
MRPNPACAALPAILATLALAGCGSSGGDKAGGQRPSKPTVLTLANGNGDPRALEPFAKAVRRRSGGTLTIAFKNHWRDGQPDYEAGLIRDVKAGKAELGWAGTRAFDDVGVRAFDALHAPLLIDSLPLERDALKSPLVPAMLGELKQAGVVGLGILPGPLRKPLGVSPLVRPQDYRGATVALQRSQVGEQTLEALGARGANIAASAPVEGYDGVEQQIGSIAGNGYDNTAGHLTANVTLWPRPVVVFANPMALRGLDDRQRDALQGATQAAFDATLALERQDDAEAAVILCRRGVRFEKAQPADLVALRHAVQPVYDRLDQRPQTKAAIAKIEAMRAAAGGAPAGPACSGQATNHASAGATPAGPRTPLDGIYTLNTTRAESAKTADPADLVSENYGHWRFVLNRGQMYYTQASEGHRRWTRASYTVKDHTLEYTVTAYGGEAPHGAAEKTAEVFSFRWSRYRDRLTLAPLKGKISPDNFRLKPWRRVGDAP